MEPTSENSTQKEPSQNDLEILLRQAEEVMLQQQLGGAILLEAQERLKGDLR